MPQDRLAERVAYKLIHHACRLQAGDFVLLAGRRDQLDLLLRLEFHALAAGGRALIHIEDEARLRRLLDTLPAARAASERLSLVPAAREATHLLRLSSGPLDLRHLPEETLQAWQDADQALQAASSPHLRARLDVALPSRRQAQRLRQPFHPYNQAIWQALDSDYALMERRGRWLHAALSDAPRLSLSDPRGAELMLRLAPRTPRQREDGVLSLEDVQEAAGAVTMLLPAGVFRVAVVEGSAEGEAIIDAGWHQGSGLRHLRLRFRAGRVVGLEGAGAAQAEAALAADDGARLLGALSIGFNPTVTTLRPYPLGSEAALLAHRRAGAVFLTLGNNQALGGTNCSALAWNLGLARATLESEGQVLLHNGEFPAL